TLVMLVLLPALLLPGGLRFCVCLMGGPLGVFGQKSCCTEACSGTALPTRGAPAVSAPDAPCADCHSISLARVESPRPEKQTTAQAELCAAALLPVAPSLSRLLLAPAPTRAAVGRASHAPPESRAPVPLRI